MIGPFVLVGLALVFFALVCVGVGLAVWWQWRHRRRRYADDAARSRAVLKAQRVAFDPDTCAMELAVQHRVAVELNTPAPASALFVPIEAHAPLQAVIVLHGEDGADSGLHMRVAARLAARGFAACAYSWFAAPGRPRDIRMIDLDEVRRLAAWLATTPEVRASEHRNGTIAVVAFDRGCELAVLAGTLPKSQPDAKAEVGTNAAELGPFIFVQSREAVGPPLSDADRFGAIVESKAASLAVGSPSLPEFAWCFAGKSPRTGDALAFERLRQPVWFLHNHSDGVTPAIGKIKQPDDAGTAGAEVVDQASAPTLSEQALTQRLVKARAAGVRVELISTGPHNSWFDQTGELTSFAIEHVARLLQKG